MALGDLPGGAFRSVAESVSADGSVVAGQSQSAAGVEAFRWTAAGGIEGLGDLPGGSVLSAATAVSGDGLAVFGSSSSAISGETSNEAFRWTRAEGMTGLGFLPGGLGASSVQDASHDGRVLAGISSTTGALFQAVAWFDGAIAVLPDFPGGSTWSHGNAVSADGTTIAGMGTTADGARAALLTTNGPSALPEPPGMSSSAAFAVSSDGAVIVGDCTFAGSMVAARWTEGGVTLIGDAPGWTATLAASCSADGAVVVGQGLHESAAEAFVWSAADGIRSVRDVLRLAGVVGLSGWHLVRATDVSADGSVVVGEGVNPGGATEGWLAVLAGPAEVPRGLLPGAVRVALDKKRPQRSRLTLTAAVDAGTMAPDLSLPFTLRAGSTTIAVPALAPRRDGSLAHRGPGLTVTLVPREGSSRVGLALAYTGELAGVPFEGDVDLILEGQSIAGAATVALVRGRFALGPGKGVLVAPPVALAAVKASVPSDGPHTLKLAAAVGAGPVGAFPQDVRIVFEDLDRTIPAASFSATRGRWTYAADAPGVTRVVLDPRAEALTIEAKGVRLGAFGEGHATAYVRIDVGSWSFSGEAGLRRKKDTLTY